MRLPASVEGTRNLGKIENKIGALNLQFSDRGVKETWKNNSAYLSPLENFSTLENE